MAQDIHSPIVGGGWGEVRGRRGWAGAEEEVAPCTGTWLGNVVIGGIAVGPKYHIAGMEADRGRRMGSAIVEEFGEGPHRGGGAVCLLRSERAECSDQGAIDSAGMIVEKNANDLLDTFLVGGIQGR